MKHWNGGLKRQGGILLRSLDLDASKVTLYCCWLVVIKLRWTFLLDERVLKWIDHVGGRDWFIWRKKAKPHIGLVCLRGSREVLDIGMTVGTCAQLLSHRFGSHLYGIKMSTLFECQWFSWMLKWHIVRSRSRQAARCKVKTLNSTWAQITEFTPAEQRPGIL